MCWVARGHPRDARHLASGAPAGVAVWTPYWSKQWAVTAKLSVDFLQPVPLLSTVCVRAGFAALDSEGEGGAAQTQQRLADDDELAAIAAQRAKPVVFAMRRIGDDGQPIGPPLITASAVCVVPKGGVEKLHESAR